MSAPSPVEQAEKKSKGTQVPQELGLKYGNNHTSRPTVYNSKKVYMYFLFFFTAAMMVNVKPVSSQVVCSEFIMQTCMLDVLPFFQSLYINKTTIYTTEEVQEYCT